MKELSILIPVFNEEIHIERALKSAFSLTRSVFVIDSYSTDKTVEIAESMGAKVYQYKWEADTNWSKKFNWALANIPFGTKWVMRLDADEYFTPELVEKVKKDLPNVSDEVTAININRREYFMRRWMKHGGTYPKTMIRIMRTGKVFYESRILDEHVEVSIGRSISWNVDLCDDKITSLTKWVATHNRYAIQEAIALIDNEIGLTCARDDEKKLDADALKKRKKKSFYGRLPYFWRAWAFFFYRYILKLGFLDGVEGFLYCFLQCLWYRNLADAKIVECYRTCGKDKEKIKEYFLKQYNIDLN